MTKDGDEEGIPFFRYLAPTSDGGGGEDDSSSKRVWLERLRGRFDVNVSTQEVQASSESVTTCQFRWPHYTRYPYISDLVTISSMPH